jgi:signal transduction histidine kinase
LISLGTLGFPVQATISRRTLGARSASQALLDSALAALAFAAMLGLLAHAGGSDTRGLDALGVVLAAVSSLPLVQWRRAPLGVFVVTVGGSAALMALGYAAGPPVGATIALYLLAASRDDAHPWTVRTTGIVAALFAVHFGANAIGHGSVSAVLLAIGALVWAVAWFAGERTRLRRQQLAELRRRAVRAERDAENERRLAVAEERARIARDLHDSAAHAINVIAVQAGAARLLQERDPSASKRALSTIEDVAAETVSEIDRIVQSLRDQPAGGEVEPAPGLGALDTMVARHMAGACRSRSRARASRGRSDRPSTRPPTGSCRRR